MLIVLTPTKCCTDLTVCIRTLTRQDAGKAGMWGEGGKGMEASPPSQHGCHQTAAPSSSLVFLREDYEGLESSSCLGVRCETTSLTPCHAPARRENIICSSGSEPAGECSPKNCCLGKKSPNTEGLAAEIMAFHSTGLIHCEIWGKYIPHVHYLLPETSTKISSWASRLCVQDVN